MRYDKYGFRSLVYSAFHRVASIARYVGFERAQSLCMTDLDSVYWLEYRCGDHYPLALIEAAEDHGQSKPATAIRMLAERARLPAYVVLHKSANTRNPADPRWPDIASLRIKRLWPFPEQSWRHVTPQEWADAICRIREWSAKRLQQDAANDSQYFPKPDQGKLFG